ncbi:hypothetical protein [Salinibacterium sp. ZJ454]|uniref:hypothetical protein n=1 Tax=Salinibacterium sp. ZJ454 TaxID=2708339 RepID=UPI00141DC8E7|nr:hypothetical protein [Salinibacterium sp. ZJ454]
MTTYWARAASDSVESGQTVFGLPTVPGLSLFIVGCVVLILMGLAVVTGRWKTPVRHVLPGVGSGLLILGAGMVILAVVGIVGSLWTLETTPEAQHSIVRGILMIGIPLGFLLCGVGLVVGSYARPRWLLPRWQREELAERDASRRAGASRATSDAAEESLPSWASTDRSIE